MNDARACRDAFRLHPPANQPQVHILKQQIAVARAHRKHIVTQIELPALRGQEAHHVLIDRPRLALAIDDVFNLDVDLSFAK